MFKKLNSSLRKDGIRVTVLRVYLALRARTLWQGRYRRMLAMQSNTERFTTIYRENLWNDPESVSGAGSTLEHTQNLRARLPRLMETHGITPVLDAPCGDFNWMKEVLKDIRTLDYTGGDIVADLIDQNQTIYGKAGVRFEIIDITQGPLPIADLMIVRDCLFHLSFADVAAFLTTLCASEIRYLLTTTHDVGADFNNIDIVTGNFRRIDLFSPPFSFPVQPLERIDDYIAPYPVRQMCLFEVAALKVRIPG